MHEIQTTVEREAGEIWLNIEFNYDPPEPQELNYPGCCEELCIVRATNKVGTIIELSTEEEDRIEAECLEHIHGGYHETH